MLLLAEKLGLSIKLPFKLEHHHHNSDGPSPFLHDFQSKISNFLHQFPFKHGKESKSISLSSFHKCFELMHITNRAFAKLVVEINYPMSRWGGEATDEYLNYTLILLQMLNSITSSLSHINKAKISIFHGLRLVENSPASAAKYLKKIPRINLGKDFGLERSTGIEMKPGSDERERVIVQALIVLKKAGFLALGLVVSGLCSDAKLNLEIGEFGGESDDEIKKVLESRFGREKAEIMQVEEVREVNCAVDRLSAAIDTGICNEAVRELKGRMEVLENLMQGIEKQANDLFSEVLATRNKLLDNIRFMGQNH